MTYATSKTTIHVSTDIVWQVVSDFGSANQYLAGIVDCTVEGEGIGIQRTLTSVDGSAIVERLDVLDAVAYRLSYTLLTDTPFRDCQTTMMIKDLGQLQAELTWSVTFEPDGIPQSEAVALMEAALAENCLMLKQFLETTVNLP